MEKQNNKGTLYLVGTPIGNLGDLTFRALDTLKHVDLIAAEDTRQTQKLLSHFSLRKPVISYFEHNKKSKGIVIINELMQGKKVAIVSDAGMPGISDPGSDLVKDCIARAIPISVIPGPSALLTGLVASGLDTRSFVFLGFFPRQKNERKKLLEELIYQPRTAVFFESPHRLCASMAEILAVWGDRNCCVARELTKLFEEYRRGSLSEILRYYQDREIKGEITLMVAGYAAEAVSYTYEEMEKAVKMLIDKGFSKREAVKEIAVQYGASKRELYNRVMRQMSSGQ